MAVYGPYDPICVCAWLSTQCEGQTADTGFPVSDLYAIGSTFEITIVFTGHDLAGANACWVIMLVGMRAVGKKGVASRVHAISDGDRTRVAHLIEVVSTFTDLASGNNGHADCHFHGTPPKVDNGFGRNR